MLHVGRGFTPEVIATQELPLPAREPIERNLHDARDRRRPLRRVHSGTEKLDERVARQTGGISQVAEQAPNLCEGVVSVRATRHGCSIASLVSGTTSLYGFPLQPRLLHLQTRLESPRRVSVGIRCAERSFRGTPPASGLSPPAR